MGKTMYGKAQEIRKIAEDLLEETENMEYLADVIGEGDEDGAHDIPRELNNALNRIRERCAEISKKADRMLEALK